MFKINEANWDRIARVVLGAILLFLGLGGTVTGILGVVFDILGVILLVTGVVGVFNKAGVLAKGSPAPAAAGTPVKR